MTIDTEIMLINEDVGKNLYRKKTFYTLVIEQEVLADNKDQADKKFLECGVDHSQINHELTETKDGVETYMVDVAYNESEPTEYMGKVTMDEEEDDIDIDTTAEEQLKTPYTAGEGI